MNKDYEICQEACKKEGCYCPPSHEFHAKKANLPMWARAYHERVGYLKALDDHNILHGKAAEKFLRDMKRREKHGPTKKQAKFLEECKQLYKQTG